MALSLEYCSTCNRLLEIEVPEDFDNTKDILDFICPVCKNPIFACETCGLSGSDCNYDGKTCKKYNNNAVQIFT